MNEPAQPAVDQGAYKPLTAGVLLANRFRIKGYLRADGETHVYRASDLMSGTDVSLRTILLGGAGRAALERDLGKAQRVAHKNAAATVGVASHGDLLLVASELEDGHTLRQLMDAKRAQGHAVGLEQAHTLLGHIASMLDEAHHSLAHGGINPENIWLTRGGKVRVAELGLAAMLPALARRGAPAGAPGGLYLAPEVARGAAATALSDVYSLGAILFELVTGTPPAPPLQPPSRLAPGLSMAVDQVVGRALLPSPEGRFPSPSEMVNALVAAMGATRATVPPPAAAPAAPAMPPAAAVSPLSPSASAAGAPAARRGGSARAFNVAAAAGLTQEEARWLVQKDRMDFGPFTLQDLIGQIERGTFSGDDLVVDGESGDRKKIKDHPQVAEYARHAQRRFEQTRRAQAEQAQETVERKKSRATVLIIGVVTLALAGGLGFYLWNRQAAQSGELASRVGEADIDAFLKNVKIDFARRRPQNRPSARSGGGGSKDDPFNSVTNMGDVSQGGGDEMLGDDVIQKVMMGNYRKLIPCIMEEKKRSPGLSEMDLEFLVLGSGKVSAVKVNGQRNGGFAGCVLGRMQSFGFPKYNGSKTIASWSMSMR